MAGSGGQPNQTLRQPVRDVTKGGQSTGIRAFVSSLKEHLQTFTPAELYLLFQQNGLLTIG